MSITRSQHLSLLISRSLRVFVAALGAVTLWTAVAVPWALAAPTVTPIDITFGAGEVCAFPIRLVAQNGQEQRTTHGVMAVTGPFKATVTNLSSGVSLNYNVSGPGMVDPRSGQPVLVGPSLVFQPASVGEPFFLYIQGRVVFTEQFQIDSVVGKVTDVCAQLA
jgi:hypothetical protein